MHVAIDLEAEMRWGDVYYYWGVGESIDQDTEIRNYRERDFRHFMSTCSLYESRYLCCHHVAIFPLGQVLTGV